MRGVRSFPVPHARTPGLSKMSGALIILRQNRLMSRFRDAGATNPAAARQPNDIGCRTGWLFQRMVARGVFVLTDDGRFYLDENAAQTFVVHRRARIAAVAALLLFIYLIVMLATRH
jgi:hypothetical protein